MSVVADQFVAGAVVQRVEVVLGYPYVGVLTGKRGSLGQIYAHWRGGDRDIWTTGETHMPASQLFVVHGPEGDAILADFVAWRLLNG